MKQTAADAVTRRIEFSGILDHQAQEALRIELERLAKQCGVLIREMSIEQKTQYKKRA